MDWKSSAHTGGLQVREFTRDQQRTVEIFFDRRIVPGQRQRFEEIWKEHGFDEGSIADGYFAVRSVRGHAPARLVAAVPVGSREACAALRDEVDELVCLVEPEFFGAVGSFYRDFRPTEDAIVERLLKESGTAAPA